MTGDGEALAGTPPRPGDIRKYARKPSGAGYTRPSAIITSPPYEGIANSTKNTNTNDALRGHPTSPMSYTRNSAKEDR